MEESINIRFTFYSVDKLPPQIVDVSVPLSQWERAQQLEYDVRMDYVFRICNFTADRDSVSKVDVKILPQ